MTNGLSLRQHLTTMTERSASLLLMLLLLTDLAFIAIHLVYINSGFLNNSLFSIETDRGYSEIYQYVKYLWIILLFSHLLVFQRIFGYIAWILVFGYFLIDDAASIHEAFGDYVAANFALDPPLLRPDDVGEIGLSVGVGLILLGAVLGAYSTGSRIFRKISLDILLLIAVMVFFGVGMDMLHIAIHAGDFVRELLGVLEDGGEMLAVSFILWYAFMLVLRHGRPDTYLHSALRRH